MTFTFSNYTWCRYQLWINPVPTNSHALILICTFHWHSWQGKTYTRLPIDDFCSVAKKNGTKLGQNRAYFFSKRNITPKLKGNDSSSNPYVSGFTFVLRVFFVSSGIMKIVHEMGIPFLNRPVFLNFGEESVLGFVRGSWDVLKAITSMFNKNSLLTNWFLSNGIGIWQEFDIAKFVDSFAEIGLCGIDLCCWRSKSTGCSACCGGRNATKSKVVLLLSYKFILNLQRPYYIGYIPIGSIRLVYI